MEHEHGAQHQPAPPVERAGIVHLLDVTGEVALLLDHDQAIAHANAACSDALGWDASELAGRRLLDLVAAGDREVSEQALSRALRQPGARTSWRARLLTAGGEKRPFDLRAVDLLDDPAIGALVVMARDTTDFPRSVASQRHAEERLRAVFEHAPLGVSLIGLDGRLIEVNRALCEMSGYSEEELVGRPAEQLLVEEDRNAGAAVIGPMFEGTTQSATQDLVVLRKDGGRVWISAATSAVHDAAGRILGLVSMMSDITERIMATQRLTHEATHDPLTGLPNRSIVFDHLTRAIASARRGVNPPAVLYVDLDRFKTVNDSLGHAAGDDLLILVARRIINALRAGDVVARHGGDEFIVLCEQVSGSAEALDVAARIRRELVEPFEISAGRVELDVTIGVTLVTGELGPDDVLLAADRALYRGKTRGGGCVVAA